VGFDDSVKPLGHGAIRFLHLGDLREHIVFPVRFVCAPRQPRRAAAFSSCARSRIAARSSSVNPSGFFLVAVVLLDDFRVPFLAGSIVLSFPTGEDAELLLCTQHSRHSPPESQSAAMTIDYYC
jgi:hypothetical protein